MELVNIGFGNLIAAGRLIAVVSPDSAPIKRLIQETRDGGMLIDATYGRKTASVLIMDSDHVVLSALPQSCNIRVPKLFMPSDPPPKRMYVIPETAMLVLKHNIYAPGDVD